MAAGLAVATVVAGAGGCSKGDDYCTVLRAATSEWAAAGSGLADREAAAKFVVTVRAIEAAAPEEVKAQWTRLRALFEKFADDDPDLAALSRDMSQLSDPAQQIETHAEKTCHIRLSSS